MRKEVKDFSEDMERILKENDHKSGWKNDHVIALYERVEDEVKELKDELFVFGKKDWCKIQKEAVDVANFAMMIWDLAREKEDKEKGTNRKNGIIYKRGDVLEGSLVDNTKKGKIIPHICNNQGGWGSGFVLNLSKKWKKPETEYRGLKDRGGYDLGKVQTILVQEDDNGATYVANMIAQDGFRSFDRPVVVNYQQLAHCLYMISNFAIENNLEVHTIRIGCGLGGGDWDIVEQTLVDLMVYRGVTVVVYDL